MFLPITSLQKENVVLFLPNTSLQKENVVLFLPNTSLQKKNAMMFLPNTSLQKENAMMFLPNTSLQKENVVLLLHKEVIRQITSGIRPFHPESVSKLSVAVNERDLLYLYNYEFYYFNSLFSETIII